MVVGLGDDPRLEAGGDAGAGDERMARGGARRVDPRLVRELGQLERGFRGRAVRARQDEVDRVVEEMDELDRTGGAQRYEVVLPEDRDVDLAPAQARQPDARVGLEDVRVESVLRDGLGDDRGGRAGEGGDADRRLRSTRERLGLGLRLRELRQDLLGPLDEQEPRGCEMHAAAAALEQLVPELALERAQLLGDGGRRERERLGGGSDRAVKSHLAQRSQSPDVEHQFCLTIRQATRAGAETRPAGTVRR